MFGVCSWLDKKFATVYMFTADLREDRVKTPSKQILEFRKVGFEVSLCHRDGRKCVGKFQGFGLVSGKSSK